jgi:molybdopterin-guanine dinucleotide biosynthesis protein A
MPTLVILAGGSSSRMGRDKALLDDGRGPLLGRLAALGLACGLPVLVVGRLRPAGWPLPEVGFLPDALPDQGPLGGLVTALRRTAPVLLIACDLAAMTAAALRWLMHTAAQQPLRDGVVSERDGLIEPLFACYTARVLPKAEEHLANGQRALHRLIADGDFRHVPLPAPLWPALANINTPEDWRRIHREGEAT